MEHETAIETRASERYVLGEMTEAEAAEFEAHYFDCRVCAQDVQDTARFADNARVVLRGLKPATPAGDIKPASRPWYRNPQVALPYAAVLILGIAVSYQAVVMNMGSEAVPRSMEPTILRVVRAAPPVVNVPAGQDTFLLVIDINTPEVFPGYRMDFLDGEGSDVTVLTAAAPESGTLHLLLPSADFPEGSYTMVLQGMGPDGATVDILEEYRFQVVRED